ncbi:MAG TPA: Na+/H+ antiporter subunit E, partial [Reyranella sp.]|nr:Na+/H+ antiporter subunit E [Reyranella sp.]
MGFAEESKVCGEKPVGVRDALRRSSRIFILSSTRDDGAPRPAWVAAGRAILFLAFWLMIAGYDPVDLPIGLIAAATATWTSLRLLPEVKLKVRLLSLATFTLHFLRQSARSGVEVAWRAFNPRLPLDPGFVVYPCRLRSAGTRSAFCALSSLLPGTLPAGSDETGALLVH